MVDHLQNQNQIFITTSNKTKNKYRVRVDHVDEGTSCRVPVLNELGVKVSEVTCREYGWDTMGTISITLYTLTSDRNMVLVGTDTTLRCYGLGFECLSLFYF